MRNSRSGFTMIELMVVVIIIGILAALAIPRVQGTKDKAYLATVRSDVRNAETAEEEYFSDHGMYGTVADLQGSTSLKMSAGVTTTIILNATGYSVASVDPSINSGVNGCEYNIGMVADPATAGTLNCDISSH